MDQTTPDWEAMSSLPLWAFAAFATRCARRSRLVATDFLKLNPKIRHAVDSAIALVEEQAIAGKWLYGQATHASTAGELLMYVSTELPPINSFGVVHAAADAVAALGAVGMSWDADASIPATRLVKSTLASGVESRAIAQDFGLLREVAKAQSWTNATPIPASFFAVRLDFRDAVGTSPHLVTAVPAISEELLADLRRYPGQMLDLDSRRFEELVAALLERFGFSVELTLPTRDKGRDIIAIDTGDLRKYLIECKRYRRKKVGIEVVQRLHGVVESEGATKGIVATTSSFTAPALDFLHLETVKWRLEGRDFDGLVRWLQSYDKLKMTHQILP